MKGSVSNFFTFFEKSFFNIRRKLGKDYIPMIRNFEKLIYGRFLHNISYGRLETIDFT
jgi:hypothetical protein